MHRDRNVVVYKNYVAEHNENNIVYILKDESVSLSLRWMNERITEGPYSLFLAVDVHDNQIENIYIENLQITSSSGSEYYFNSIMSKSLLIYSLQEESHLTYDKANENMRYYQFDDKFSFNFEGNEEFTLVFSLRYEGKNIDKVKNVQVKYKPYNEELYAPIK